MASIYDIKPAFQQLLRPLTRGLAHAGVTANQVTVAAALLSAAVGACIGLNPEARWPLLVLPGLLFVRMALNAIDGMLAREHGMKSRLGAVLNEIGDVLADTALYLPLALVPGFSPRLIVVITLLAIVSEMTGVVAVQIGATRRYEGPMGKSDRAFVFGLLALLLGLGVPSAPWLFYVEVAMVALLGWTIVNRARRALAEPGPVRNPADSAPAMRTLPGWAWLAFAWGLAEATFFFIVPDVLSSRLVLTQPRAGFAACFCSLAGALVGGLVLYILGRHAGTAALTLDAMDWLPGISPALAEGARQGLERDGVSALLLGIVDGVPFKLYAVQAAGAGLGAVGFVAASVVARLARFLLVTGLAWLAGAVLLPNCSASTRLRIHAGGWCLFYLVYFWRMGL